MFSSGNYTTFENSRLGLKIIKNMYYKKKLLCSMQILKSFFKTWREFKVPDAMWTFLNDDTR